MERSLRVDRFCAVVLVEWWFVHERILTTTHKSIGYHRDECDVFFHCSSVSPAGILDFKKLEGIDDPFLLSDGTLASSMGQHIIPCYAW